MPFSFIPGGLLLALAVLGGIFVLFGLALKAFDWTIDATRGTALVGIVSGLRDWQMPSEPSEAIARAEASATPSLPVEETVRPVEALERVTPDRTRGRREP
jgi:hypothetical protein